jgi:CDP-diacylglycerol--serine O-phosphatidyltransferase
MSRFSNVMGRSKTNRLPTDPAMAAIRAEKRRARLQVLPSLFTLGNAVCGFAAIVQVASLRFSAGAIENPQNLVHAAWLILAAMVFDAFDGRIARMTKTTGDFGAELDSLCDAVSFGVAPALMVAMANATAITAPFFAKLAWVFGAAHACGAILRLARFNVENSHDEDSHMSFKGLPSPAAAGMIVSAVLLQGFLREDVSVRAADLISRALPFLALASGYLMVSKLRYTHIPNKYLRGRKSPRKIAIILFTILMGILAPEVLIAAAFIGFAAWGPVGKLVETIRTPVAPAPAALATLRVEAGARAIVHETATVGAAASKLTSTFELKPPSRSLRPNMAGDIQLTAL